MHSVGAQPPLAHGLQTSRTGQSSDVLHSGVGFGGHANSQLPFTQSISAHEPPGHTLQIRSTEIWQSALVVHWPGLLHFGVFGEHIPFASQNLRTAVSAQSLSFGSHTVHGEPQGWLTQGL